MTFIARILRFLFWLLIVSWSVRLLRQLVATLLGNVSANSQQAADATARVATPDASRRLVRDPVCGMHVDEALSIPLRAEGELVQFCSITCRDQYAAGAKKMAANG